MYSLTQYELEKIWKKKEFIFSMAILLLINLFLLWYTELPNETKPPLSAYRIFQQEIDGLTEQEKDRYMNSWKETLDTMAFVQEVLTAQRLSGELGEYFLKQALESRPGIFEKSYESFQKGDYLKFTDSFYQEKTLAEELYREWQKVSGYGNYLRSVQENKEILEGISIFSHSSAAGQDRDGFSARNIAKSAADYGHLTESSVRWMPGKSLVSAIESIWTDLLLLLSVFLFVGNLIFQEKERKLNFITRSTRRGIYPCVLSKLAALFLHCMIIVFLLYGANLLFYGVTAGLGSVEGFWKASLQSIAEYRESAFSITTGQFVFLCVLTKGIALFGTASLLTAFCILADNIFFPYGAAGLLCGAGWMLYLFVPAGTKLSALKYLNPAGVMRTENLYGRYLNFNLFGYPVSRTGLSWILIASLCFAGIALCLFFYGKGKNLCLREKKGISESAALFIPFRRFPFREILYRTGLLGHECYKIMIAGRALPILLIFLLFIGYEELTREYGVSVKEQYYQEFCLSLEGELTPDKEAVILAEEARFQEAFNKISQIEAMVSEGKISAAAGEDLKSRWYAVTAFYPSFQRIWQQYKRILDRGGYFIYDTGYLYLFGPDNTNYTVNLLLLSVCSIFTFGNCFAAEYKSGAWRLLNASKQGKNKVFLRKMLFSLLTMAVASWVPFVSRAVNLSAGFPLHGLSFPADNIPYYSTMPSWMPVTAFLLLILLSQSASLVLVTLGVVLLSGWRRDYVQTVFFSLLLFVLPLTLKLLGFELAGCFSVYSLYAWTAG